MFSLIRLMCLKYMLGFLSLVIVLSASQPSNAQRALAFPGVPVAQPLPVMGGYQQSILQSQQMLQLAGSPASIGLGGGIGQGGFGGLGGGLGGFGGGFGGIGGLGGGLGGGFGGIGGFGGGFNGIGGLGGGLGSGGGVGLGGGLGLGGGGIGGFAGKGLGGFNGRNGL